MTCPLHVHTDYSNLDAISQPVEIAHRCVEIGAPYCGITDHGVVTGHLEFHKEMTKVGVKPILGIEAYHATKLDGFKGKERDQSHLILLAMNPTGLKNLYTLVSKAADPKYFRWVPRLTWEMLETYNEGLIATSACALGLVPKGIMADDYTALNRYLDIFHDRFYIELSTYDCDEHFDDFDSDGEPLTTRYINTALAEVAQERGLPLTYGNDAHYARPDQYDFYDAYIASGTRKKNKGSVQTIYTDPSERSMWHPNCLYVMGEDDVRERLNYLSDPIVDEVIDNSMAIGEACDSTLPKVERHLPTFIPSESPWLDKKDDRDASELFIDLVTEGVKRRYPAASQEIWDRALREVEVFLESGLEHLFLLDWDKNQFCDRHGILRGPGRGSAAGCLVAYALGLTDADPLHYGLIFERFWNPGRAKGFPDIDTDYAREHRGRVIQYLQERWGVERVKMIGNTGRMKPLAAIDRFYAACDIPFGDKEDLKKIVKRTPDIEIHGSDVIGWDLEGDCDYVLTGKKRKIYVMDHVGDQIKQWINQGTKEDRDKRIRFVWMLSHIVNRVEGYGIHASGVVVSDVDLYDTLPYDLRGPKDARVPVTSWPMDDVDALMFIKLDVLGLKTLDTLFDWQQQVAKLGVNVEWSGLDLETYPDDMWELLHRGFTAGVFQVEGGFAKQLCEQFRPSSVEDLAIIVALNRPGPIRSGAPERFIARRSGAEPITFDHSILADILDDTYGLFIYQEQVIAFFNKMGYTLSESDAVRKILGKKKPEDLDALAEGIDEWKITGNDQQIRIQPKDADGNNLGDPELIDNKGYFNMARLNGIEESVAKTIWDKIVGFASYSFNKSHAVAYAIIGFRCLLAKYYAPSEFYRSCINTVEPQKRAELTPTYIAEAHRMNIGVYPPDITKSEVESQVVDGDIYLGFGDVKHVKSGGEVIVQLRDEGVDMSTPEKLADELERRAKDQTKLKTQYKKEGKIWDGPTKSLKQTLQANKIAALFNVGAWDSLGERNVALSIKQKFEKDLLGCIISDNSHQILMNNEEEIAGCDAYWEVDESIWDGEKLRFTVPGVITHIKDVKSKKTQQPMGIITIEYEGDTIEFATSPQSWKTHRFLWKERATGIFTLNRTERGVTFEDGYLLK